MPSASVAILERLMALAQWSPERVAATPGRVSLKVAGLFAGIGGLELGLARAGHRTALLSECDPSAAAVLRHQFPDVDDFVEDVREVPDLGGADLLTAGFPCQDLSQAGRTAGITGARSGLVGEVFRLLDGAGQESPRWLLLENVPFMLQLDGGGAMRYLTGELTRRGWRWAYRVVDSRAFGLPQRRQRVLLLASKTEDPRPVLLTDDAGEPQMPGHAGLACGFYWTEGTRGLGWAVDAIPTLKSGSALGIPSPPAIWMPDGRLVLPDIRDAERLQGFPPDWTAAATNARARRDGPRWRLVGNAVSVPVAAWLGDRLADYRPETLHEWPGAEPLQSVYRWPKAAWGDDAGAWAAPVSAWPQSSQALDLAGFLRYPATPLSHRAASGFLRRAEASSLRFPAGLLEAVRRHIATVAT